MLLFNSIAQIPTVPVTSQFWVWLLGVAVAGLLSTLFTLWTSRFQNRNLISQTAKTNAERDDIVINNTTKLMQLKEKEVIIYKKRIDSLEGHISILEAKIHQLSKQISILQTKNERLASIMQQKIERMFISDGKIQLIFEEPTGSPTCPARENCPVFGSTLQPEFSDTLGLEDESMTVSEEETDGDGTD